MKTVCEKLKKINTDYKGCVDELAAQYEWDSAADLCYNEEIKAQRLRNRITDFNGRIDRAAENALAEAALEIDKLRGMFSAYIANSDDAATLAAVRAIVSAGVELSDGEAAVLSERGGFVTLKLLEKHTGGRIKAPDMESFGRELGEIRGHFNSIKYYRGGLASIAPASEWGHALHPATMSGIQQGLIEHFAEKLDCFAERWACVQRVSLS